jgi:hypothetical protein
VVAKLTWALAINLLIFLSALIAFVFKLLLWHLTRFWPFAVFAVAFFFMVCIRGAMLFCTFASAQVVVLFWPLTCVAVVGLYFSLRRLFRKGINGTDLPK